MKFGVTTSTRSMSGEATTDSQSVEEFCQPQFAANSSVPSPGTPVTVCMIALAGGVKKRLTCPQAFECERPMKPWPIRATLISGIVFDSFKESFLFGDASVPVVL